jgi:hypothetical protein
VGGVGCLAGAGRALLGFECLNGGSAARVATVLAEKPDAVTAVIGQEAKVNPRTVRRVKADKTDWARGRVGGQLARPEHPQPLSALDEGPPDNRRAFPMYGLASLSYPTRNARTVGRRPNE